LSGGDQGIIGAILVPGETFLTLLCQYLPKKRRRQIYRDSARSFRPSRVEQVSCSGKREDTPTDRAEKMYPRCTLLAGNLYLRKKWKLPKVLKFNKVVKPLKAKKTLHPAWGSGGPELLRRFAACTARPPASGRWSSASHPTSPTIAAGRGVRISASRPSSPPSRRQAASSIPIRSRSRSRISRSCSNRIPRKRGIPIVCR